MPACTVVSDWLNDVRKLTAGNSIRQFLWLPVPVAAQSKSWAFGRSPAENVGSNPTEDMDVCLL